MRGLVIHDVSLRSSQQASNEASRVLNINVLRMYLVFEFFKYKNYYFVTQNDFFMNLLDTLNLNSRWFWFRSSISNSL